MQQQKEENDRHIEHQENINSESENFKEEFHLKIGNLKRDVQQKHQDLEQVKQIKSLEIQKFKD